MDKKISKKIKLVGAGLGCAYLGLKALDIESAIGVANLHGSGADHSEIVDVGKLDGDVGC